jgi:putative endopeptidase
MKHIGAFLLIFFALSFSSQNNSGIALKNMNTSLVPGNDFYNFCNGTWQKEFQLPESDARYGSFNEIHNANLIRIKTILNEMAANKVAVKGSDVQRLRDFYLSGMDSARLDLEKNAPIQNLLNKIDSISSPSDFIMIKAYFDQIGIPLLFSISVAPDFKNSRKNIIYINQAGYGMGDREYYHASKHKSIRDDYERFISNMLYLSNYPEKQIDFDSGEFLAFEINLTDKALNKQQLRESDKIYNPLTYNQLKELSPSIDWNTYFKSLNIGLPDSVVVTCPEYLKKADILLQRMPIEVLKLYAKIQVIMQAAPYLSTKMQYLSFDFKEKTMSGNKTMKPRWERVFKAIDREMGEMFSKEYVKRHFSAESKIKVNKMIDQLVAAYRERIATRTWMSAETKLMANKKLDRMIRKIGYPDKWKTYQGLSITKSSYWDNVCAARAFEHQDMLNELKKPVNRYKWQMTPVTVNAYYDPSTNEITFPAAILQPPFFDPKADDAANYGTMGSIIGHELTHGFDDEGAKFDAYGNLKMWWTETDFKNFKDLAARLVEQYNAYVLLDSLHVNGQLTLGENIADLGGVTLSYRAYKKTLGATNSKTMDGFSGEQRFFIAWAQGWKSKVRDEELKRLLSMDYHSPAYIRAFVPLTNLKEFHEAFHVKPGDKLYREEKDRVEIW